MIMVAIAGWVIHIVFLFLPTCCCECVYKKENHAVEFWRVLVFQDKHGLPEIPMPTRGCSLIQEVYEINLFNMYNEAWDRLVQPPHFPHLGKHTKHTRHLSFRMVGTLSPLRTPLKARECLICSEGLWQNYLPPTLITCILSGEQVGEARTPPHPRQHEDPRPFSGAEGLSPRATSGVPIGTQMWRSGVQGFLSYRGTCRDIQNCVSQAYDPSNSVFHSVFKTIDSSVWGFVSVFLWEHRIALQNVSVGELAKLTFIGYLV